MSRLMQRGRRYCNYASPRGTNNNYNDGVKSFGTISVARAGLSSLPLRVQIVALPVQIVALPVQQSKRTRVGEQE